ncbi:MAG: helix-turn-helix domain-containing protein [Actinomycetes bacterium]
MALVVLSVVEQRLDAVRAVLGGADVVEVAAQVGVHRSTLHRWVARYLVDQIAGLSDRSHRPHAQPRQVPEAVEVALAEMRREHPRWGRVGFGWSCCADRCRGRTRWSWCPRNGPSTGS